MGFLGPLATDGVSLRPRARKVLAILGAHGESGLSTDALADAVWYGSVPTTWREQIRYCIWEIRKSLGPDSIERVGGKYRLARAVVTDVTEFERLLEQARKFRDSGEVDRVAATLSTAAGLWRGRPFEDVEGVELVRHELIRLEELHRGMQEDLVAARIDAGDHRDVVAEAEALVAAEPLRERRWALLALAHYRSGNQAAALRSLQQARRLLADELGLSPGEQLIDLERAVLQQEASLRPVVSPLPQSGSCPYKGLTYYGIDDSDIFFGRDSDVDACLERLDRSPLLVLAGPSGCGKSSLARAGIAAALLARGRSVVVIVPGADPDGALTQALSGVDDDPIVVVDQLEELFAAGRDERVIGAFLSRLVDYAVTTAPVVVTVRSDHLGTLGTFDVVRRPLEDGLYLVSALSGGALRTVIEEPATRAGCRLEAGLSELLMVETGGERAALPLLSHALAETWEHRTGRVLTVDAYRTTGGIDGAVARSAERLWERVSPTDRPRLKTLLLRLVAPGASSQPVRVHLDRRRLTGLLQDDVIDLLLRYRLVTADDRTICLAHDAVTSAWPRLRSWVEEDQAGQRVLHHLASATEEWEALGRTDSELYRGARLENAIDWIAATEPDLTAAEREFIAASEGRARSERAELERRAKMHETQNRRLRIALVGIAVALLVAVAAAALATVQRGRAREQERANALSALTSESTALRASRRDVAALLAIEAYRLGPDASTESALFGTFTSSPNVLRTVPTDMEFADSVRTDAAYLRGGRAVAVIDGLGRVVAIDLESGEHRELARLGTEPGTGFLARSADGRWLVAAWSARENLMASRVAVIDTTSGSLRFEPVDLSVRATALTVAGDGSRVAVQDQLDATTWILDGRDGSRLTAIHDPEPRRELGESPISFTFLPTGNLAIASRSGTIRIVNPDTGREFERLDAPAGSADLFLRATPDGKHLVMVGTLGVPSEFGFVEPRLSMLDLVSGVRSPEDPVAMSSGCASFELLERTGSIVCADGGGLVLSYDIVSGRRLPEEFDPQQGDVCALALDPGGTRLSAVSSCRAGAATIVEFAADGSGDVSRLVSGSGPHRNGVLQFGFEGQDDVLVVDLELDGRDEPVTHAVDATTGEVIDQFPGVYALIPTDEPTRAVAISGSDGSIGRYDTNRRAWVGPRVTPDLELNGIWARGDVVVIGGYTEHGYRLTRLDLDRGTTTAPTIDLEDAQFWDLEIADDALYAAGSGADGPVIERRSLSTGELLARSEPGYVNVTEGGGIVIAGTSDGQVHQLEPETLRAVGRAFPAISGPPLEVALDDLGERLMVHGEDRRLRIYDVASRLQLGDAIVGVASRNEGWSAIRPDGGQIAVDTARGAWIWDLDVSTWVESACRVAGRNLTRDEWKQYIGDLAPYRESCTLEENG